MFAISRGLFLPSPLTFRILSLHCFDYVWNYCIDAVIDELLIGRYILGQSSSRIALYKSSSADYIIRKADTLAGE